MIRGCWQERTSIHATHPILYIFSKDFGRNFGVILIPPTGHHRLHTSLQPWAVFSHLRSFSLSYLRLEIVYVRWAINDGRDFSIPYLRLEIVYIRWASNDGRGFCLFTFIVAFFLSWNKKQRKDSHAFKEIQVRAAASRDLWSCSMGFLLHFASSSACTDDQVHWE